MKFIKWHNKDSAFVTGGDFYEGNDFIDPTIILP